MLLHPDFEPWCNLCVNGINYSWQDYGNKRQFAGKDSSVLASVSVLDFTLLRTAFVKKRLIFYRVAK